MCHAQALRAGGLVRCIGEHAQSLDGSGERAEKSMPFAEPQGVPPKRDQYQIASSIKSRLSLKSAYADVRLHLPSRRRSAFASFLSETEVAMLFSEFDEAYEDDLRPENEFLSMPISGVNPKPPVLVDGSVTVAEAVLAMNINHTGCVLVMRDGKLAGIFTERDVLTKVIGRDDGRTLRVEHVMTKNPETLKLSDDLAFALHHMKVGGYRHIPLVEDGKPVGLLSVRDVVHYLADLHPEEVLNLPSNPDSAIFRTVDGG
jgi:CBS domain-containing protein